MSLRLSISKQYERAVQLLACKGFRFKVQDFGLRDLGNSIWAYGFRGYSVSEFRVSKKGG